MYLHGMCQDAKGVWLQHQKVPKKFLYNDFKISNTGIISPTCQLFCCNMHHVVMNCIRTVAVVE